MLEIEVTVRGEGPTQKVIDHVHRAMREQLGATRWTIHAQVRDRDNRITETGYFRSEGKR